MSLDLRWWLQYAKGGQGENIMLHAKIQCCQFILVYSYDFWTVASADVVQYSCLLLQVSLSAWEISKLKQ